MFGREQAALIGRPTGDSFRKHTTGELGGMLWKSVTTSDPNFERDRQSIPQVKPTFGEGMSANQIKATWLGLGGWGGIPLAT